MRSRLKAALAVLITALTLGAMAAAPAGAVTGGTPDGGAHPNVGLILGYADDGGRYRCSATLVTPTVLLTAAHCTDGIVGKMLVTFKSVIAEKQPTTSPFPAAANPAVGYTQAELEKAGFYSGTPETHPAYSDFTDLDNWNDVGVVLLDQTPTGITPAELAPIGYLDDFAQPNLNKTIFTSVGYGTEVRKPDSGPKKPTPFTYPLIRRNADQPGQKLTDQILQLNGNPNDTKGTGGTCFGDSGGPTFLDGYVVTVTSYAYTSNCRYLGGYQRVDIDDAQDWLAEYGVVPAA
jgi:hypothetical protein